MRNRTRAAFVLLAIFLPTALLAANIDGSLLGPETFERGKGAPVTETRAFAHSSDDEVVIRIFNGGPPGSSMTDRAPVTSAMVNVAGQGVFSQDDFQPGVEVLESRLAIGPGDHELEVRISGKPGTKFVVEILSAPSLVPPSDAVRSTAKNMLRALPGAQIDFGQKTGHIISVRSPGLSQLPTDSPPIPLSESRGTGDEELASALVEFFDRFGYIWGIDNPINELFVSLRSNRQYDNTGIFDPSEKTSLVNLPAHGLEMVNMHQGVRVLGRYAHGVYDGGGNLQLLTTNIEPILKGLDPKPLISEQELPGLVNAQMTSVVAQFPSLYWLLDGNQPLETGTELVWLPPQKGGNGLLQLAWDFRVRNGMKQARFWIDAKTGEILRSIDASPTEWFDEGVASQQFAMDEAGNMRSFPTTRFDDRWYMGYGNPYLQGNAPYFAAAGRFQVSDNTNAVDRTQVTGGAISIRATGGNLWATDPRFTGTFRAAVSMADNITKTLDWWAQYGWRSWDGRGSTLWTAVNGNRNGGVPHFNAYGANGGIMTTDGTREGYTTAGGLETIGHEVMHNVVDATTNLEYYAESGAINEALADMFGVALTAVFDALNNDTYGEPDFGGTFGPRNFVNPGMKGDPEHYSNFRYTTADSGGVHSNSGILNRAHATMMVGRKLVPSSELGVAQTTEIVRAANQLRLYSSDVGMDEFAAVIRGYCRFIRVFSGTFGRAWPASHCDAVDWAYSSVGIAPFNADDFEAQDDLMIQSATWSQARRFSERDFKEVWLEIRNKNRAGAFNTLNIQNVLLIDELGDSIVISGPESRFTNVPCGDDLARFGSLAAGSSACIVGLLNTNRIAGYMTGPRNFDAEITLRNGDSYPVDNIFPATVAPDYEFDRVSIRDLGPTLSRVWSHPLHNIGGFPEGLQGRYLVRSGNVGPLSAYGEVSELSTDSDPSCRTLGSSNCLYHERFIEIDIDLLQTELALPLIIVPSASRIPGSERDLQVWVNDRMELPTASPGRQFFALIDASDIADESDESNNLICVNCVQTADAEFARGVRVRLPEGVDVDSLFPITVRNAARKLPAGFPRLYEIREHIIPDLGHPLIPVVPLP